MYISRVLLKNFAAIYSGLKTKQIELNMEDLTTNKITLLLGPNGSGKTAILSNIHPFAYPGSMDIRNNGATMFLENEVGLKELTINSSKHTFEIKHIYSPSKTGRTVKSFISKDGVELNPNGNVSSFKEYLEAEMGATEEIMGLLRLGNNVINFSDKKAADRKVYAEKLMSDLNVCGQFYKKMNEDSRYLKKLLEMTLRKIQNLNITDIDNENVKIDKLYDEREVVNKLLEETKQSFWVAQANIEKAMPNGVEAFIRTLELDETDLSLMAQELKLLKRKHNNLTEIYGDVSSKQLNGDRKKLKELTETQATLKASLAVGLENLDRLENNKMSIGQHLDKFTTTEELELTQKHVNGLSEFITECENKGYHKLAFKCNTDDLKIALSLLQEIDMIATDIYSSGVKAVDVAMEKMRQGKDIEAYVSKHIINIDNRLEKMQPRGNTETGNDINHSVVALYVPQGCMAKSCPYYKRYHTTENGQSDIDYTQEIRKLEAERDYYLAIRSVGKKLDLIKMIARSNAVLAEKMPVEVLTEKSIMSKIDACEPIYEEDVFEHYFEILEEYELYCKRIGELETCKRELDLMTHSNEAANEMRKSLTATIMEITSLSATLDTLRQQLDLTIDQINKLTTFIDGYDSFKEVDTDMKEQEAKYTELTKSVDERKKILKDMESSIEREKELNHNISTLTEKIKCIDDTVTGLKYRVRDYKKLRKDYKTFEKKFDDVELIKKALSTKEGIPLLMIQVYFKRTSSIVNKLLSVTDMDIEIGDFEIDDKRFEVPYYKGGTRIGDIALSSDGERALFNIALSFALLIQTYSGFDNDCGEKYNVMLLDEFDAALDKNNRKTFIDMYEKQSSLMGIEQAFFITHNNFFSDYPCNAIITSDKYNLSEYKNLTEVQIKRK